MKKQIIIALSLLATSIGVYAAPGDDLLMAAGIRQDLKTVKSLIEDSGVSVNFQNTDDDTALMKAAMYDNLPIVQYLLHKNADINLRNKLGRSALIWLAMRGGRNALPIARLLLEKGANLEQVTNDGQTALAIARKLNSAEIVELLEKASSTGRSAATA